MRSGNGVAVGPTAGQIEAHFRERGWPRLEDFRFEHLTATEGQKLANAVKAVRSFGGAIREGASGLGMLLIASAVDDDWERTGYGCGKTTLARCVHYANSTVAMMPGDGGDLPFVMPQGWLLTARELVGLFDEENFDQRYIFSRLGNLLVVDDVGREGDLRWTKRDPDIQQREKAARYYQVVDHCMQQGINLLITSNLSAKELAGFLGGATWSRLLGMCPPEFRVNLTGLPDYRPRLGKQRLDRSSNGQERE